MMTNRSSSTDALRPTARRASGDLCPSRARPQAAGPPSGRTRAVGQIGPPAFLMPSPCHTADPEHQSREAHPTTSRIGPAAFRRSRPSDTHQILESPRDHPPEPRTEERIDRPAGRRRSAPSSTLPVDRPPSPALLIEDVTKRFVVGRKKTPVTAISHVSMRLERGDIHGILGANGSGKSTLIRLICGLLTLDEGRVEVFGHDIVRDEMAVKRLINRVSVDAAFFKKLSPMENLLFAARLYGLDGRTAKREAIAILARLGISEKRHRPADRADEPGDAAEGRHRASAADEPDPAAARRADDRPRPALEARRPVLHRGAPRDPRRDDRPDDPRPGRGRTPVRPDHDPQRRPGRRRGHARTASRPSSAIAWTARRPSKTCS